MTSPKRQLAAWNLLPRKHLGQNFLSDPAAAQSIVSRAALRPDAVVLEIGAGLGALTLPLARAVAKVYAVEADPRLIPPLTAELHAQGLDNVSVLAQDILQVDVAALARSEGRKLVVMGNLPYNLSSQILVRLIDCRAGIEQAVLMFQKELAHRISARPGGRQYGRLTVMLQYCAVIRTVTEIPAALFFPKPKVDSVVLGIRFREVPPDPAVDEAFLFRVIKAAFGQRRKTLKNALVGGGLGLETTAALKALALAAIVPTRRAETLNVAEFVALSNRLFDALGHSNSR